MSFTEVQIQKIQAEFQAMKRYKDKVRLYDRHFNILPFTFPRFQTDLYAFFEKENIDLLESILDKERATGDTLIRTFSFENRQYTFSVKPSNSNAIVVNDYVIAKFLSESYRLERIIRNRVRLAAEKDKHIREMLDSANKMLGFIEYKSKFEYDRSLKVKFMNVFVKGAMDYRSNTTEPSFSRRRKFIELYLYSQGHLYSQYIDFLKRAYDVAHVNPDNTAAQEQTDRPGELSEKVSLLRELGLIDIIKKKYPFLDRIDLDRKIVEVIRKITGEDPGDLSEIGHDQ